MITSDSVASTPHHAPAKRPSVLVIAMNYAPEVSGTAPYTQQLAEHLTSRYDVQVIAGLPHYPEWKIHDGFGAWRETRVEGRVTVVRLRHFVPRRLSSTKRVLHEITFAIRALFERGPQPDLVVAVSPPIFGALAGMLIARRAGVPFGVIVQDVYSAGLRELAKDTGLSRMPAKYYSRGFTLGYRQCPSVAAFGRCAAT
jgi:colanic acid biosynthesis glycosyl transferase WcaI